MGQRSLVLFTLLTQAACGALVGLAGLQLLGAADVLGPLAFVVIGLLILAALTISTLHLGAPQHAAYAITNWRSSWLSREILALGLSGGLVAIGALVALLGDPRGSEAARTVIALLAAATGIVVVATMVQLYSVRTVPEWRRPLTAAGFAGTTLRLGSVTAAMLAAIEILPHGSIDVAAALWLILMLGSGIGLWLAAAGGGPGRGRADRRAGALLVRGQVPATGGRGSRSFRSTAWGAVVAAVGSAILVTGPALLATAILAPALAMLAIGELDARERFYRAAPRQGRDVMRPPAAARSSAVGD